MLVLSPDSLVTLEEFAAFLPRAGSDDTTAEKAIRALNSTVAWMRNHTGRRLRARNYTEPVTVSGITPATGGILTAASGFLVCRVGDDVKGAAARQGMRIASITDDTTVTVAPDWDTDQEGNPATPSGPIDLSFGSRGIWTTVNRDGEIQCPEYPVLNLYAATYRDSVGEFVSLDLTSAIIERETGRIRLPYATVSDWAWRSSYGWPRPDATHDYPTVRLEVRAGYEEPTAEDTGDPDDWHALVNLTLRIAAIHYQDSSIQRGRLSTVSVGSIGSGVQVTEAPMPVDILSDIQPYRRLG